MKYQINGYLVLSDTSPEHIMEVLAYHDKYQCIIFDSSIKEAKKAAYRATKDRGQKHYVVKISRTTSFKVV